MDLLHQPLDTSDTMSLFCDRLPCLSWSEKEVSCLTDIHDNWGERLITGSESGESESVFSDDSFKSELEESERVRLGDEDLLSESCPVSPPSDAGYSSQGELNDNLLLGHLDIAGMLSVGREELEEVDRVSNLISGSQDLDLMADLEMPCSSVVELATQDSCPPSIEAPLQEDSLDCDLGQFDFNLAVAEPTREMEEQLEGDLARITEELAVSSSSLWAECFPQGLGVAAASATTEYDDLLDSILSSPDHSIDPEYFNSDYFDIDSVDPTCLHNIKAETAEEEEEEDKEAEAEKDAEMAEDNVEEVMEEPEVHSSRLDHDYSLPPSSSLLITPPHSEEEDCGEEEEGRVSKQRIVRPAPHKPHTATQIIKFQHKKDLKFVMSFQVKSEELIATSPRSLLKSKLAGREGRRVKHMQREEERRSLVRAPHKSAKELVREIIEKRSRGEKVRGLKRRVRPEGRVEARPRGLTSLNSPPDIRKYRKFEEERELHNSMERQRRVELKDAYDGLKDCIPAIATEDKVSKLMILNTASDFCGSMEKSLVRLRREKEREAERGRRLLRRLELLRSS